MAHEQTGTIKTQGSKFNDVSFPADFTSLFWENSKLGGMKNSYKSYVKGFKRPSEMTSGAPSLWGSKDIRPHGVHQGMLGDCWFLASMAAVGEWKERVHKIFSDKTDYPSDGKFNIKLWNQGQENNIVIDDTLAVRPWGSSWSPVHTKKSPAGAWWSPILEKAAAKFYGTYENMHGGWMVESLYALTGMPTVEHRPSQLSESELWNILQDFETNNHIMTAAVMGNSYKHGLVNGHAYTVIGVATYKGQKLVKLRNPWGSERYVGPWSDQDKSKWTQEAKDALDYQYQTNNGAFWMPLNLFKSHIYTVHTALYHDW